MLNKNSWTLNTNVIIYYIWCRISTDFRHTASNAYLVLQNQFDLVWKEAQKSTNIVLKTDFMQFSKKVSTTL